MTPAQFLARVKKGTVPPATLLLGPEAYQRRRIKDALLGTVPADINRELLSRTRYKIVSDPNQADAVLTGTVNNFVAYPTISAGGRSTTVEAVVTLQLTLTNRANGAILFTRAGADFRERYELSIDPKAYFDESGTAMERLSQSVARSVVSAILEKF